MRILLLTHRLPYAPNRGDRIRAHHLLRSLATWAHVDLLSLVHDPEEASHAGDMSDWAETVTLARVPRIANFPRALWHLARSKPVTHALLDSGEARPAIRRIVAARRPDLVLAYCSGVAQYLTDPALRSIPAVVDMVDVDSKKWAELAPTEPFPKSWVLGREVHALRRFEADVATHAAACLTVNERERDALQQLAPAARVVAVPNGIDASHFAPPGPARPSAQVVFCGVMNYAPNERAALWMAQEVWPLVRQTRPDARLMIVGADPTDAVRALASERAGIVVTGSVPDVRTYLWDSALAVAPIWIARGLQNKVLEAVAAGLPCVVTPAVAGGLPPELQAACPVADDAERFAHRVLALLDLDAAARRRLAESVDLTVLDWPTRLAPVREIVERAVSVKP